MHTLTLLYPLLTSFKTAIGLSLDPLDSPSVTSSVFALTFLENPSPSVLATRAALTVQNNDDGHELGQKLRSMQNTDGCCSRDAKNCADFIYSPNCKVNENACKSVCNSFWIDNPSGVTCIPLGSDPVGSLPCCSPGKIIKGVCQLKIEMSSIRFSKVNAVQGNSIEKLIRLPLTADNFPVLGDQNGVYLPLAHSSKCPSVITEEQYPDLVLDLDQFTSVIGEPRHPSNDPDDYFWSDFMDVIQVQKKRIAGGIINDGDLPWEMPNIWKGYTYDDAAKAVHDEFPGQIQMEFIEQIMSSGIKTNESVIPFFSNKKFVGGPVMLAALNTWAISAVGPTSFASKWKYGRSRPEEIAWLIEQGTIGTNDGVPQAIVDEVKGLNLSKPEEFTAYEEGCPQHPSWPAMHSAASSISMWLPIVLNLTPEQEKEAKRIDYAVAYARTIAGVHYATDNVAGLALGQEIIAKKLPGLLNDWYGSSIIAVKERLESKRFSWANYHISVGGIQLPPLPNVASTYTLGMVRVKSLSEDGSFFSLEEDDKIYKMLTFIKKKGKTEKVYDDWFDIYTDVINSSGAQQYSGAVRLFHNNMGRRVRSNKGDWAIGDKFAVNLSTNMFPRFDFEDFSINDPSVDVFDNLNGQFSLNMNYTVGAFSDSVKFSLYNSDCITLLASDEKVVQVGSQKENMSGYVQKLTVNSKRISTSSLVTFSEFGKSKGTIDFCVKGEVFAHETSISFNKVNMKFAFDLTENEFSVASNEIKLDDIGISETEVTSSYNVSACRCSSDHFNCDSEKPILKQNDLVIVCIKSTNIDVEISNFNMKFEQNGSTKFTAVKYGNNGPEASHLSQITKENDTYRTASRLISVLFRSSSFTIRGNAYLVFKTARRNLHEIVTPMLRSAQSSYEADPLAEAQFTMSFKLGKANTVATTTKPPNMLLNVESILGGLILLLTIWLIKIYSQTRRK